MVLTTEDKCKSKKNCCQTVINVMAENAYDLWKREGNTGTLEDFLQSLKGEKGDTGEKGEKGEPGSRLAITEIVNNDDELEELGKTAEKGTIVMYGNASDHKFGQVYIWTGEDFRLLTNLTQVDGVEGKSAYQAWLDLGNTGSEQDFIDSLKPKTDINELVDYVIPKESVKHPFNLTGDSHNYRKLQYNKTTKLGILHVDFIPTEDTGEITVFSELPEDFPKPKTLMEVSVEGGVNAKNNSGLVYVHRYQGKTILRGTNLKANTRYSVNLIGYWE